jgi:hypothetical protein
MKKCWALLIPLILMSLNFLGFILYAQPVWIINEEIKNPAISKEMSARILADVFVLSNPMNDPNDLVMYIRNNPQYFSTNGSITVTARNLGTWILSNDIMTFGDDCLEKIKIKLQKDNISVKYASELLFEMKKSKFDCKVIARELIWLSEILPELSEGILTDYLYTGTEIRQQLRKVISIYDVMHNSDPEIAELILKDKNCYLHKIADQIQLLAMISNLGG